MAGFVRLNLDEASTAIPAIKVGAPILYPDALPCAFAGYTDHMREMTGREPPDGSKLKPLFPLKLSRGGHREAELRVEIERIGRLHNPIVQGE
jgi:2-keto-4-pentenoate hydratase/2-oxohepta-3-ene-1,7-dioic acid hydratase in catechol pathway